MHVGYEKLIKPNRKNTGKQEHSSSVDQNTYILEIESTVSRIKNVWPFIYSISDANK